MNTVDRYFTSYTVILVASVVFIVVVTLGLIYLGVKF